MNTTTNRDRHEVSSGNIVYQLRRQHRPERALKNSPPQVVLGHAFESEQVGHDLLSQVENVGSAEATAAGRTEPIVQSM